MKSQGLKIGLAVLRTLIIAIGSILLIMIAGASVPEETYLEGLANYGGLLNGVYNLMVGALILCAAAAIIFGLVFFFGNIKNRMGSLIGFAVFAVIGLISFYALADGTVLSAYETSGIEVTEGESSFAGGGVIFVYILGGIALLSIIWAEVSRFFK